MLLYLCKQKQMDVCCGIYVLYKTKADGHMLWYLCKQKQMGICCGIYVNKSRWTYAVVSK